uniref:Solute carrier family 13 member 3 n=1 Tax=Callorhinchus milii TaxID=7868 RepID=A0A4W3J557_CALMI|eukprot:gi/632973939/ref/XP_007903395.1/ PREDICTED: solute carrier family 13 member 3-like [Callorhinchus milii]
MVQIGIIAKKAWSIRKTIVLFLMPVLLLPIIFFLPLKEGRCLYVILLMATYWCTEALPIAVTSLLPICLFPFLGVLPSAKVSPQYFVDTNVLFISGLIMALAIEEWNLHRRIALSILMFVGVSPPMLILGMMITTAFLSMWLSNTASTAMMLPIATAMLKSLFGNFDPMKQNDSEAIKQNDDEDGLAHKDVISREPISNAVPFLISDDSQKHPQLPEIDDNLTLAQQKEQEQQKKLWKGFLICIPYAASIGGTATVTGTAPNLILLGQVKSYFPDCDLVNFGSWFMFACPLAFIFLFFAWLWIAFLYGGLSLRSCRKNTNVESQDRVKAVIKSDYAKLGPMKFAERSVAVFFFFFAIFLFTRDPKFIPGWAHFFGQEYISDAVTGLSLIIIMFAFPSQKPSLKWWFSSKAANVPNPSLLSWKKVQANLPWNVVLLLGGGFAMAKGCEESGLSRWIGKQLHPLEDLPPSLAVLVIAITLAFFTEFASNTATIIIFLPIVTQLAIHLKVNPLYLMIPGTVGCSFAFMLPVATPPNSIAFSTGHLMVTDMVKTGVVMNIMGIIVLFIAVNTWGLYMFQLNTYPDWAKVITVALDSGNVVNGTMMPLNGTL